MWLTKIQVGYLLEANDNRSSHPLEVFKNRLVINLKHFNKEETRAI
jgi:hypothetical protein